MANKTGKLDDADSGPVIIGPTDTGCILCVISNEVPDTQTDRKQIVQIACRVYAHCTGEDKGKRGGIVMPLGCAMH